MGKNKSIAIKDTKELQRVQSLLKTRNYKAYILFQIGLATGYRGGDLVRLTVLDVKKAIEQRKFVVAEEKINNMSNGKKNTIRKETFERVAYISDNLIKVLKEYIDGKEDSEFLYPARNGKGKGNNKEHVRRDYLGKQFKKAIVELGMNMTCGTHTPRKTYGYIQYNAHEKDITFVQELFGHSTPKVTRRYIGIDEDEKRESAQCVDKYIFPV